MYNKEKNTLVYFDISFLRTCTEVALEQYRMQKADNAK